MFWLRDLARSLPLIQQDKINLVLGQCCAISVTLSFAKLLCEMSISSVSNRTCSFCAEGELLPELGCSVLVDAGDPRPVQRARPQPREDVHAAVEILTLTSRCNPAMIMDMKILPNEIILLY